MTDAIDTPALRGAGLRSQAEEENPVATQAVAVSAVVVTGIFLSVVAWQLLAIGRAAVLGRTKPDPSRQLQRLAERIDALEAAADRSDDV